MKKEVQTPAIVGIVVLLLVLGFFLIKSLAGAGNLDNGEVKYTPGKPPWMETDPSKKGPGGPPPSPASAVGSQGGNQSGQPNAGGPPGASAPVLGNTTGQ